MPAGLSTKVAEIWGQARRAFLTALGGLLAVVRINEEKGKPRLLGLPSYQMTLFTVLNLVKLNVMQRWAWLTVRCKTGVISVPSKS
jgi:hypothetical protein